MCLQYKKHYMYTESFSQIVSSLTSLLTGNYQYRREGILSHIVSKVFHVVLQSNERKCYETHFALRSYLLI